MTFDQGVAFAILLRAMALFVWGRPRYDIVACLALMATVAAGLIKPEDAFDAFSDDIVAIVRSALVVSAAITQTGVPELALQRISRHVRSMQIQLLVLVATVTVLSAFVKNAGALAIMILLAFQMARRSGGSASCFLMPMAFGALLGGLMTQIGTSPNIIVSRTREEIVGAPFSMFDFTPVGAALALAGLLFLMFAYRLLPVRTRAAASLDEALAAKKYVTEAEIVEQSPMVGKTIAALQELADGEGKVIAILQPDEKRVAPLPDATLNAGDTLILEGDPHALERIVSTGKLKLESGHRVPEATQPQAEISSIEAVIGAGSPLIGLSAQASALFERFGVNLLAVGRTGERLTERLGTITLQLGDVIVLQGNLADTPERLKALQCLPLAERTLHLGKARQALLPILILVAAMVTTAIGLLPVSIAFFSAAVLMVLTGGVALHQVYQTVEWPIIIMLGALIPVSEALRATGGADLIAGWLSQLAAGLPAYGALALILAAAMLVTPFLNNAATVLVMVPILGIPGIPAGRVPDGGGDRGRLRFPDAHRAPMQHAGHGTGRIPLRGLCAARRAPLAAGDPDRRACLARGMARALERRSATSARGHCGDCHPAQRRRQCREDLHRQGVAGHHRAAVPACRDGRLPRHDAGTLWGSSRWPHLRDGTAGRQAVRRHQERSGGGPDVARHASRRRGPGAGGQQPNRRRGPARG
jgi:di/tricarboxylate transporter